MRVLIRDDFARIATQHLGTRRSGLQFSQTDGPLPTQAGRPARPLLRYGAPIIAVAAVLAQLNAPAFAQAQTDAGLPGGVAVAFNAPPANHVTRASDGRPLAQHERGNPVAANTIYYRITLCTGLTANAVTFRVPISDQRAAGLDTTQKLAQVGQGATTTSPGEGGAAGAWNGTGNALSVTGNKDGSLTWKITDGTTTATFVMRVHFIDCSEAHGANDGHQHAHPAEIKRAVTPHIPSTVPVHQGVVRPAEPNGRAVDTLISIGIGGGSFGHGSGLLGHGGGFGFGGGGGRPGAGGD